jgi:hypothetical protein
VRQKIQTIAACDPLARIIVVAYSGGTRVALSAIESVQDRIDLLIYVAGNMVFIDATLPPANVCKLVNVRAHGAVANLFSGLPTPFGDGIDGAANYDLGYVPHSRVPMNRCFQQILTRELYEVALGTR